MKFLSRLIVWFLVFLAVLAFRFPYEPIFLRFLAEIQEKTNATMSWDNVDANLLGAKITNFHIQLPSGFQFDSDQATITPSLNGLVLNCTQTAQGGNAKFQIDRKNLSFQADKLVASVGFEGLGKVTSSGHLLYALSGGALKGEMRLVIPELSGLAPIPITNLEVGVALNSDGAKDNTTVLDNKLTVFAEGLDGEGQIGLTFHPDTASPALSGEITVTTNGFGTHTIKLGGTLAQPEWNLAGANK